MSLLRVVKQAALVAVLASSGCRSTVPWPTPPDPVEETPIPEIERHTSTASFPLSTVSYDEPVPAPLMPAEVALQPRSLPPVVESELSADWLVDQVLARNPSLEALAAAWQAAAQRYPQAVSLDDPMFLAMMAPASFDSDEVDPGYTLEAAQKLPWFGKRALRGRRARAEAQAAYFDVEDGRRRLEQLAREAFYDYYLARRQRDLNRQNLDVLRQFRSTAQSRYEANQVTQQDLLQAELELGGAERREIELARAEHVARARINTLLREDPAGALPAPPTQLGLPTAPVELAELQQAALSQRPDLAALSARVRADQAALALACKDYYPDTEIIGRYDAMWQERPLQPAVGVKLNVPLYGRRLSAAVREAQFALTQRRAELDQLMLDVRYEVAEAFERMTESRRTLALYDERLLPTAEQNVATARGNYDVNKVTFFELASAQRQLIALREEREAALADYHTRAAELRRAVGGPVPSRGSAAELPTPSF